MKHIFLLLSFLLINPQLAKSAQNALVVTDGAIVYKKASFDAAVIGYFRAGEKVRISSKTYGPFYKVRFKQGVIGYISDVDVKTRTGSKRAKRSKRGSQKSHLASIRRGSALTKTAVGLSLGMLQFKEAFEVGNDVEEYSSNMMVYGLKGTFPLGGMGPLLLDTSLLYHSGIPSYLKRYEASDSSGKLVIADASLMYVVSESMQRRLLIYLGGGALVTYSSWFVEVQNSKTQVDEAQFGGVLSAGAAYRFSNFVFKVEPKFYITKSNYFGGLASVQMEL